jgi:hypothetical protein
VNANKFYLLSSQDTRIVEHGLYHRWQRMHPADSNRKLTDQSGVWIMDLSGAVLWWSTEEIYRDGPF